MSTVTLKGKQIQLETGFLREGEIVPDFVLASIELQDKTLKDFEGKKKIIATVPSIDTSVCEMESKEINKLAQSYPSALFLIISKDLPFALDRFCKQTGLNNIVSLSDIRSQSTFGKDYGINIISGPLNGLLTRSIFFINESNKIIYSELVPEITSLPNFKFLEDKIEENM